MLKEFKLERYFGRYEFSTRYLLSSSDCESLRLDEVLAMASPPEREAWERLNLGYTESQGWSSLRTEIARMYAAVPAENVFIAAPEEAIYIAMHALLQPGEEVIVLTPAYQSLYEVARGIGCRVIFWPLVVSNGKWVLNVDRLNGLITPATRMIVINFPHNPTGYLARREEMEAAVRIARSHNLLLFSDEMYRFLEPQESLRLPPAADLYENAISLSGLSKSYALPGLRIGWLAVRNPAWVRNFLRIKDYLTICSSAPSEFLARLAVAHREEIFNRNRQIVTQNEVLAESFCGDFPQLLEWLPPQAGSVAFPRWRGAVPVEEFCEDVLARQGVMIVPASMFEFPAPHFRVGLGRRNFPEALAHLWEYLEQK